MKKINLFIASARLSVMLVLLMVLAEKGNAQNATESMDLAGYRTLDTINYVGKGYMKPIAARKNYAVVSFVFEAGARNNWHLHPGAEQLLYVLEGEGYYQQEGKPKQIIKKGDLIIVPPDTKHWNGASPKGRFLHLSLSDHSNQGHVKWFAKVSEQEYQN